MKKLAREWTGTFAKLNAMMKAHPFMDQKKFKAWREMVEDEISDLEDIQESPDVVCADGEDGLKFHKMELDVAIEEKDGELAKQIIEERLQLDEDAQAEEEEAEEENEDN